NGNTYLLQRLGVKSLGGIAKDKVNTSITLPSYIKDVAKVQIYCAWAEAVLGDEPFSAQLMTMNRKRALVALGRSLRRGWYQAGTGGRDDLTPLSRQKFLGSQARALPISPGTAHEP